MRDRGPTSICNVGEDKRYQPFPKVNSTQTQNVQMPTESNDERGAEQRVIVRARERERGRIDFTFNYIYN